MDIYREVRSPPVRSHFVTYADGSPTLVFDTAEPIVNSSLWRKNPKDRRPKPADVIYHNTPLTKQFTILEQPGWYEDPIIVTGGPTTWLGRDFLTQYEHEAYGEIPAWDWPLTIREKLEALEINLGTSLAEYRETASMFGEFAKLLRNSAYRLKELRKFKHKPFSAIGGHYLTYSYGLKPLAGELGESIAALMSRFEQPIWRKLTASNNGVLKDIEITGPFTGPNDKYSVKYRWIWRRKVVCWYQVAPGTTYSSFSVGNPLEWAWELTPFSFVADWGWTIGDALGALDALRGIQQTRTTFSVKYRYDHTKIVNHDDLVQIRPNVLAKRVFWRDKVDTIPLPSFFTWKPSKSYYTIKNGTALVASLVGKMARPSDGPRIWHKNLREARPWILS